MSFDAHKNFAYSTVATAPSPASSGTSLVVAAGQGALFPATPFNATIWPAGAQPLTTNAEIVRVTGRSTDTLTIVRAQEGSSARTIVVGDQIANTITVKTLTDVEDAATAFSTAGGDLSGTYPNPTVAKINGSPLATITDAVSGDRLRFDGTNWNNSSLIWVPVMALDPTSGNFLVVTSGDGDAIMTEV